MYVDLLLEKNYIGKKYWTKMRMGLGEWYSRLKIGHNNGIIRPLIKGGTKMPKIIPIKDLKNTSEISDMCHRTDEPIYITKNGYGDMVIMSMENFEQSRKRLKMYEDIDFSEDQIKEGKIKDARSSLASMRERYGL